MPNVVERKRERLGLCRGNRQGRDGQKIFEQKPALTGAEILLAKPEDIEKLVFVITYAVIAQSMNAKTARGARRNGDHEFFELLPPERNLGNVEGFRQPVIR